MPVLLVVKENENNRKMHLIFTLFCLDSSLFGFLFWRISKFYQGV